MRRFALRREPCDGSHRGCRRCFRHCIARERLSRRRRRQAGWPASIRFSDELGGFTITGVSGTGTKDDPIVITEELNSASPVTLVIRATDRSCTRSRSAAMRRPASPHMRFVTLNNSGLAWVEFEFELQEIKDVPSMFGDGLSFDQRRTESRRYRVGQLRRFQPRLRALRPAALPRRQGRPAATARRSASCHRLHAALAILYRPGSAHPSSDL